MKVVNITSVSVFPVGVYLRRIKPNNIEEFFHEFILEFHLLHLSACVNKFGPLENYLQTLKKYAKKTINNFVTNIE